jgi:ribosomal protein S18 acetylase RimI-like enzyme
VINNPKLCTVATKKEGDKVEVIGGILSCISEDNKKGIIVMVNILPEYRGLGLGNKLLDRNL